MPIEIGDILQIEPGNMVGPTAHGIGDIIAMDPNAEWYIPLDGAPSEGYVTRLGDNYGDCIEISPRIIKIPFYSPDYPPDSGRNTVTVVRLGAFFLEGVSGRNVYGRFMEITTSGIGGGGGSTSLYGVRLVR